ncbi:kinase [Shewanella sp. UCD-KL12]|uniref:GHMP family kinase ATP-binding protein n=1 Tax=Shewanella sp. UCD-KL12 TaxID=1917163 RepID=UPI0009713689|nr:kinase [Shewanella sp. UCD-KL12]
MIISRTPFRVSFFGGGSDYPTWYKEHGGAVIGTAINKYCYLTVRNLPPFFEHKHRIVYSKVELPLTVNEIQHPSVRAVLSELHNGEGIEIHHQADLPARSGLGSSSSFTVGLLNAMRAKQGKISSPHLLGEEAIRIEQEVIKENVGSQDQLWAAHGGTNFIEFSRSGEISVTPLIMHEDTSEQLNSHIMLFFTGLSRIASEIAGKQIENLAQKQSQITQMAGLAFQAKDILQGAHCDIADLGEMLVESWHLKKQLASDVSSSEIDDIYQAAMDAGAYGGKLLGAGGGGFMMFLAKPEHHAAIKQRLSKFIHVNIKTGACGSKIVMYEPNGFF